MYERPTLDRPVLIGAFRGWNDGGQAATLATGYLARQWGAHKFADIDPELFVDFQATRPSVSLEDGKTRRIEWPETAFFRAHIPETSRDAVLLIGVEPNYRWRTFSGLIADLAQDLGVEMIVTLGALLADVPHTRAAPVTGAATDQRLVDELGLQLSRYEGLTDSEYFWEPVANCWSIRPRGQGRAAIAAGGGDFVIDFAHPELDGSV